MMIKKVDTYFLGVPRGQKHRIWGLFWGLSNLSACRYYHQPKLAEKVHFGVLHHPTKFEAKILTG